MSEYACILAGMVGFLLFMFAIAGYVCAKSERDDDDDE